MKMTFHKEEGDTLIRNFGGMEGYTLIRNLGGLGGVAFNPIGGLDGVHLHSHPWRLGEVHIHWPRVPSSQIFWGTKLQNKPKSSKCWGSHQLEVS